MAFDTLSPKLQLVAKAGQGYLTSRFGRAGLKLDEEIDPSIAWRPTIQLRPNRASIIAADVSDSLYPSALKIAALDVLRFDYPISMYLVCPLDVYLADKGQKVTGQLRRHGFGLLTVDDDKKVVSQSPCIPLAQFLAEEDIAPALTALPQKLRVAFRAALETYRTNEGQGLQQCGQVVEAIVRCLAKGAATVNVISPPASGRPLAEVIDDMYATSVFKPHRAALGGARDFVREYRNIASHPADTPKRAIEKIRKCKAGVVDALRIAKNLVDVISSKRYPIRVIIT